MYEVQINSESLEGVNLEAIKQYLRTEGCDAEDALLESQIKTAIKRAENYCNRTFTKKSITVTSDLHEFALLGMLDEVVKVTLDNNEVTANYEVIGRKNPKFIASIAGTWAVTFTTIFDMPPEVEEFVRQSIYKMYERGEANIPEPDHSVIKPYKRMIWLV